MQAARLIQATCVKILCRSTPLDISVLTGSTVTQLEIKVYCPLVGSKVGSKKIVGNAALPYGDINKNISSKQSTTPFCSGYCWARGLKVGDGLIAVLDIDLWLPLHWLCPTYLCPTNRVCWLCMALHAEQSKVD